MHISMTDLTTQVRDSQQCYDFRHLERGHLQQAADLINRILSTNIDAKYLEWKYFNNPAGNAISIVIIFNDTVVGILAALPMRFSIGQIETIAVEEVDLAISEEHRRLDTYLQMVGQYTKRLIKGDIAFTYGITSANASSLNQSIIGKTQVTRVPRLVRVLNTAPFLKKKIKFGLFAELLSPVANIALGLRFNTSVSSSEGTRIKRITKFDKRFDAFWQKTKQDYQTLVVRNATYLNWRYAENGHSAYEIVCLEENVSREVRGYIVMCQKREKDLRRGLIMELVTLKKDLEAVKLLLNHAIGFFQKKRLDAVECWMLPHCDAYQELIKSGFRLRQKEGMCLHFQHVKQTGRNPLFGQMNERKNWYMSLGDSDLG